MMKQTSVCDPVHPLLRLAGSWLNQDAKRILLGSQLCATLGIVNLETTILLDSIMLTHCV